MSYINVILLDENKAFQAELTEIAKSTDIYIDRVNSEKELYEALATIQYNVAIITIDQTQAHDLNIVTQLRKKSALGIIVLTAAPSTEHRILSYESGADHFFSSPIEHKEIVAAIRNLFVRLTPIVPNVPLGSYNWQLDKSSWCLITPDNHEIKLTAKELKFLELLMSQFGENVDRHAVKLTLGYTTDDYGNRSIDSLVRRLRKKVLSNINIQLPLQTVHAVGYCFSASAQVLESQSN